jgi:hypothetical protein
MIMPLGSRITVFKGHRGWAAIYHIIEGAASQEDAQAAADAFRTPYTAGWRDAMKDLLTLWIERARSQATWRTEQVTEWLRELAQRLAPAS